MNFYDDYESIKKKLEKGCITLIPRRCGKTTMTTAIEDLLNTRTLPQPMTMVQEASKNFDKLMYTKFNGETKMPTSRTHVTFYYTNGSTYKARSVYIRCPLIGVFSADFVYSQSIKKSTGLTIDQTIHVQTKDLRAIEIKRVSSEGSIRTEILQNPNIQSSVAITVAVAPLNTRTHNDINKVALNAEAEKVKLPKVSDFAEPLKKGKGLKVTVTKVNKEKVKKATVKK